MRGKTIRLDARLDSYVDDLLKKMMEKEGQDKSKIVRAAIEYYANYVLGQDEVQNTRMYHLFENKK